MAAEGRGQGPCLLSLSSLRRVLWETQIELLGGRPLSAVGIVILFSLSHLLGLPRNFLAGSGIPLTCEALPKVRLHLAQVLGMKS